MGGGGRFGKEAARGVQGKFQSWRNGWDREERQEQIGIQKRDRNQKKKIDQNRIEENRFENEENREVDWKEKTLLVLKEEMKRYGQC